MNFFISSSRIFSGADFLIEKCNLIVIRVSTIIEPNAADQLIAIIIPLFNFYACLTRGGLFLSLWKHGFGIVDLNFVER